MSSEGWIKLHRQIMEKAFYKNDSQAVHLWLHILMTANHRPAEETLGGERIICQPGQFTTGRKRLATATGISESKVERLLSKFEKIEQQIEQQKTTINRLITVLNWTDYQETEQQTEQPVNNDWTASEHTLRSKEVKKLRKEEIEDKKAAAIAATLARKLIFYNSLIPLLETYPKQMVKEFYEYWTETNTTGAKMRWEMQKTWNTGLRIGNWSRKEDRFKKKQTTSIDTTRIGDQKLKEITMSQFEPQLKTAQ